MKTVRPRPRAILTLSLCAVCALATIKVLSITYTIVYEDETDGQSHKKIIEIEVNAKLPRSRSIEYEKSEEMPQRNKLPDQSDGRGDVIEIVQSDTAPKELPKPKSDVQLAIEKPPVVEDPALSLDKVQVKIDAHEAYKNMVKASAGQPMNAAVRRPLVNTTGYPRLYNSRFIPTRRIVHLDLKGAPPKVYYFEQFFRLISRLGATGILIEWEDMFPYTGMLADCRNGNAYTEAEVKMIFGWAKENNLEIIPLVQTFGHLEWVLKHEKFAHLREIERYAQVSWLESIIGMIVVDTE